MLPTAAPMPRNSPCGPSFLRIAPMPWITPRYSRGASLLDCSSPCSCSLSGHRVQLMTRRSPVLTSSYLILTVSNGWVTVTAPQAAIPPAIKALPGNQYLPGLNYQSGSTHPVVVDISAPAYPSTKQSNDSHLLKQQCWGHIIGG